MGFHEEADPKIKEKLYRNWFFTLNNPQDHLGTDDPVELEKLFDERFSKYRYAIQIERGEKTGTLHLQGTICNDTQIRGMTLSNKLPGVQLFKTRSIEGAYYYCTKESTRVAGPFIHEYSGKKNSEGKPQTWLDFIDPNMTWEKWKAQHQNDDDDSSKGRRRDLKLLYSALVKEGMTLNQVDNDPALSIIAGQFPAYAARLDKKRIIDRFEKYKNIENEREVEIVWIYGEPGAGKTRRAVDLAKKFSGSDVYLTETSEGNPWSEYEGQDTVIFDEFYGEIQFSKLMRWFDRYALKLSARYYDRWACYHRIFITSNLAPWDMYKSMKNREYRIGGFYRRITKVIHLERQENEIFEEVDETKLLENRPDDVRSVKKAEADKATFFTPEDEEAYDFF